MSEKRDTFHVGVNVFVVRDGKLLLGLRKGVYGSGTWALPGGHLENGESVAQAANRELEEETGMKADKLMFIALANTPIQEKGHYLQLGFTAQSIEGEPELKEPDRCEEWKWWDINDLPKEIFIAHDKLIQAFIDKEPLADI